MGRQTSTLAHYLLMCLLYNNARNTALLILYLENVAFDVKSRD